MLPDLRADYFGGLPWFDSLKQPEGDDASLWYLLGDPAAEWYVELLNCALAYADAHELREHYRKALRGITASRLSAARAVQSGKKLSFPVWEIVNELVVGAILEYGMGWTFTRHAPPGRGSRCGEWEFQAQSGDSIFVEVKSLDEHEMRGTTGVYIRPDSRERLHTVIEGAYRQVPDDGRRTMVVICGDDITRAPFGILHSDVFQAMYGQYVVEFPVDQPAPRVSYAGPSFRGMAVHATKHRRLGCLAGLSIRGLQTPQLQFYAIQNAFANSGVQIRAEDLQAAARFVVDANGASTGEPGQGTDELWVRMIAGISTHLTS